MRTTTVIAAAASLALAGMSITAPRLATAAEDRPGATGQQTSQQQAAQQSDQQQQPAGQYNSRTPAARSGYDANRPPSAAGQNGLSATEQQTVRDTLARIVDDATTPGRFGDLIGQLSRSDADRLNGRGGVHAGTTLRPGAGSGGANTGVTTNSGGAASVGSSAGTSSGIGANTAGGVDTSAGNRTTENTPAVGTSGTSSAGAAGVGTSNATDTHGTAGTGSTGSGSERSNTAAAMDTSDLDARISQFQRDWKAKYNQEFSLGSNAKQVLGENFARINISDYGDSARTATDRLAPGSSNTGTSGSGINGNTTATPANTGASGTNLRSTDTNLRPGASDTIHTGGVGASAGSDTARNAPGGYGATSGDRGDATRAENSAVVLVSGAPNVTPVTLRFVNEAAQWKLDLPDSLDRQQLKANLIKHLEIVDRQKDSWPADPNQAYRVVTQHILMAFNEDITQRGAGLDRAGALDRSSLNTGIGTGAGANTTGNPNANSNAGFGTGTGASSGNNSTNGTRENNNR